MYTSDACKPLTVMDNVELTSLPLEMLEFSQKES